MNRYKQTFQRLKKEKRLGFCPFAVIGDPNAKGFLRRIKTYLAVRPDMIELGIPFSDPIADGPTIQAADQRALKSGITAKKAIRLVCAVRSMLKKNNRNIPIGILTYSNIVFRYGIANFYKDLKRAGADSILIADVPLEEIKPFAKAGRENSLHQIFLASEYTTDERLKKIRGIGSGFLYVVSALGVTGVRSQLPKKTTALIKKLKRITDMPLVVGFGISTPSHIKSLKISGAQAVICGSALIETPNSELLSYLEKLKKACSSE